MLTIPELKKTLKKSGITKFKITDGAYISGNMKNPYNIPEYEEETEYVCVVQKTEIR